ncbi:LOW QUALITY PROTEIN: uncharacterized protein LOC108605963 [Drosophila busckii]|uniref:LOW QUALITY PROTEIN: uncharacterized protein LOC108605963 n=1 Tax=Drosophila busckii TaxID=30019 RepID=UPI0014329D5D|nr:LOW QUALITY PROTEIN: uncharacterized protein LOC108605963 [Drosophila busckii]
MHYCVIALALLGAATADVSHLLHAQAAGYSYSSSSASVPGADASSYQPENLIPQHLRSAESYNIGADTQTPEQFIPEADRVAHARYVQEQAAPGSDASSYQPENLIPAHLKAETESYNIGADTQTPEQFIPEAVRVAHQTYTQAEAAHSRLRLQQLSTRALDPPASEVRSSSASVYPGADSSSHQPEHLIPQHLKSAQVQTLVYPGADSSSHQPEHLIPQHLKSAQVQPQVYPGSDPSSYQPAHLIPQHLKSAKIATQTAQIISGAVRSFNIGADSFTPEQFIPEADRIAHAQYVQEFNAGTHVPVAIGRDTITPAHLRSSSYSSSSSPSSSGTQYAANGGYVY